MKEVESDFLNGLSAFYSLNGYVRRGMNFWKKTDFGKQLINFQKSSSSNESCLIYYINIGVFFSKVMEMKKQVYRNTLIGAIHMERVSVKELSPIRIESAESCILLSFQIKNAFQNDLFLQLDRISNPQFMIHFYFDEIKKSEKLIFDDFENLLLLALSFDIEQVHNVISLGLSKVKDTNDSLFLNEIMKEYIKYLQ